MLLRHGPLAPTTAAGLLLAASFSIGAVEIASPHATGTANLHITIDDTYPAIGVTPGSSSSAAYDIVATNDGPDTTLANIRTEVFPLRTAWTCSAMGGASCPAASGGSAVDHTIAMPAGARVVYRLECGAAPVFAAFPARASIAGDVHDDNLDDNTAMVVTPVFNPQDADLAVTIDADRDGAMVGDTVNYTVRAHNLGTIASSAEILLLNSAYLGTPTWTCAGSDGATCDATWQDGDRAGQLAQLPPGASATLIVSAMPQPLAATAGDEAFVQRAWVLGRNTNDLTTADNNAQAVVHVSLFRDTFDD